MTIDLSKLSPAFREFLVRKIKGLAREGRLEIEDDLAAWENVSNESAAKKQMISWRSALLELELL